MLPLPARFADCCAALLFWLFVSTANAASSAAVVTVTLDAAITPAAAEYVVGAIRRAGADKAALVVLRLDTPGGLDSSMRTIIKAILASPVPIATFVAPDGARAASAGTYMMYASHIAAMAPATNLGAATPVNVGGGDEAPKAGADKRGKDKTQPSSGESMRSKQVNDAAAYIRGLAELRGRNADWGERAVREAVSLSAAEALKLRVIDLVARDVPDLLKQLEGRTVVAGGVEHTLRLDGAAVTEVEPNWRTRLLMVVTNPSVAVILMMIGIYGLIFEFMNPGFVLPGVVGGICLLIALYAFQLLPINYAGLLLILLGIAFVVAEAFVPSFGALGIGGVAALAFGMVILIDAEAAPALAIPLPFIGGTAIAMGLAAFATAWFAMKARGRRVITGREDMRGAQGVALEDFEVEGWVRVKGERWRARTSVPLRRGDEVRVTRISGLMLDVDKI